MNSFLQTNASKFYRKLLFNKNENINVLYVTVTQFFEILSFFHYLLKKHYVMGVLFIET